LKIASSSSIPPLELLKDIEVYSFVFSSYPYNFAQPSDRISAISFYDFVDNFLRFDNAEIVFKKDIANIGDVGFHMVLNCRLCNPKKIQGWS
jgi:hypothetical protein